MSAQPFVFVCLLFFGGLGVIAIESEFPDGPPENKALAAFLVLMAVWAAGILLQPSTSTL